MEPTTRADAAPGSPDAPAETSAVSGTALPARLLLALDGDEASLRLHPFSPFFRILRHLWTLALAVGASLLASPGGIASWPWWVLAIPFMLIGLAVDLVAYARFRYTLTADSLVLEEGIVGRRVRTIPYGRIQNVDTSQGLLHRLLGVADVRVETGGGAGAEATLRVLGLDAVGVLTRRVREGKEGLGSSTGDGAPVSAPEPPGETLVSLSPRELAIHGLMRHRRATVLAALAGLAWNLAELRDPWGVSAGWKRGLRIDPRTLLPDAPGLPLLLALLVALFLFLTLASTGLALIQLWGFAVRKQGEQLIVRYGLFTRHGSTIPRHRIQTIAVSSTPYSRALSRVAVSVETAGSAPESGEEGKGRESRTWIAPVWPAAELPALLGSVEPAVALERLAWQPAHPAAVRRIFRKSARVAVVATAALVALPPVRLYGLLALPLLLGWGALHARRHAASLGYAVTDEVVAIRRGWWRRTVTLARLAQLQAVTLSESPFDRKAGMAVITLDTAGPAGDADHLLRMPYLSREVAVALRDRLSRSAARRAFRW